MKLRYAFLLLFVLAPGLAKAVTHTINFGGSLGFNYSPKTLTVSVGDVITWTGDFSQHPLQSTSVPAGAASFGPINSGTTFSYTVTVPGNYAYQCNFHSSIGMTGAFATSAAGVQPAPNSSVQMDPVFPNPAAMEAMVHFTLEKPAHVTLQLFDAAGKMVKTAADDQMDAGFHMLTIDTKQLASGSYQYVLQAGDAVLRREMIVVK